MLEIWYQSTCFNLNICVFFSYDSRQTAVPIEQNQPNDIPESGDYDVYHTNSIPPRASPSADLWSEPTAFGDRAHFRVSTWPAVLKVTGVQRFDAGTYTCRVDFRQSPTVYHHVTLDVIGKLLIRPILSLFTEYVYKSPMKLHESLCVIGKLYIVI